MLRLAKLGVSPAPRCLVAWLQLEPCYPLAVGFLPPFIEKVRSGGLRPFSTMGWGWFARKPPHVVIGRIRASGGFPSSEVAR